MATQPLNLKLLFASMPLGAWWGLWVLLAASSVALIILFRTRWRNAKAWHRCAALSLWVHLLLACVATTIRIVTGAAGDGTDAPIRVAVLQQEPAEADQDTEEPPPLADWEMPVDEPVVAPELTPPEPLSAEESEAQLEEILDQAPESDQALAEPLSEPETEEPPLAPEPESTPEPDSIAAAEENPKAAPSQDAEPAEAAEDPAEEPSVEAESPQGESAPINPLRKKAPAEDLPSEYADRFAEDRLERAARRGGSPQTERAVRQALAWLASAQSANGGWIAAHHGAGTERVVLGHNRHGAGANADTGVTGLALLAFLGAGSTHRSGPYSEEVSKGLNYLRQNQRADGALFGRAQVFAQTYCHSMASLAALEALAITGDDSLRPMCTAAVRYSLSLQHPSDGGWRYLRGHTGDTSQLGWQLMGLKTARAAGLNVPAVTWTRIDRFLRRVRRGGSGGLASYRPESGPSRTMTAEALYCRQLLSGGPSAVAPAATKEAVDSLSLQPPGSGQNNFYYWYYATLALESASDSSVHAEEAWRRWNRALTTTLTASQQADGGWTTDTVWGGYGGRVYTTALAALCLEVYYRYTPQEDGGGVASRRGWESVAR